MVKITEQSVAEQQNHTFAERTFDFDVEREARTHAVTLIRSLEIDPATMIPQSKKSEPHPGVIRVHFMPETTDLARRQIREALVKAIPGKLGGYHSDPWFTLTPETGIITHETVQEALRVLYENNAIVLTDVLDASKKLGIAPSAYKGDRARDLTGLYDPEKPEADRRTRGLAAFILYPPYNPYPGI